MPEFYMLLAQKNYQNTRLFIIFARKISQIPEFYMIFVRKMPEIYIIIARKMFFCRILRGQRVRDREVRD